MGRDPCPTVWCGITSGNKVMGAGKRPEVTPRDLYFLCFCEFAIGYQERANKTGMGPHRRLHRCPHPVWTPLPLAYDSPVGRAPNTLLS